MNSQAVSRDRRADQDGVKVTVKEYDISTRLLERNNIFTFLSLR